MEIDLRAVTARDADAIRVLDAGRRIVCQIGIELRIAGGSALGIDAVRISRG